MIFDAHNALKAVDVDASQKILPEGHRLSELFRKESKPLLVTVNRIKAADLRTEKGEPIESQLALMKEYRDVQNLPVALAWQQMNFHFNGNIPPEHLSLKVE